MGRRYDGISSYSEHEEVEFVRTSAGFVPVEIVDSSGEVKRESVDPTNPKDLLGLKKAPLRLVPPALTIATAPVMALGAKKYGPYNWREKPVRFTVYLEAMLRHIYAILDGQTLDPESGRPHVAHVAACAGILLDADPLGQLVDDRFTSGPAAAMLDELVNWSVPL